MFFGLSRNKIEKRNFLKDTLLQLKEGNADIEKIKAELYNKGFNEFAITSLAGSHTELIHFLEITNDEFEKIWTIKWMS